MLRHKFSFPNSHFLDSGRKKKQKVSDIDGKTSDCLSRNCLYYVVWSYVSASNCLLNCDLLFFAVFVIALFSLISSW